MTTRVRLAGQATDRLGRTVLWTVADGERGRRWREVATEPEGGASRSLTLETGHAGQWLRLEIAAPTGLLSLHPDRDGRIQGNVATAAGVRHLSLGSLTPPLVDVRDSLVGETALCRAFERLVGPGEGSGVRVVRVGLGLEVAVFDVGVTRSDARLWELRDSEGTRDVSMGDLGTPSDGDTGGRWPLETGS
jgi:hypothetical protein